MHWIMEADLPRVHLSFRNPFWNSPIREVCCTRCIYWDVYNNNELDWDDGYDWLDQVMKKIVLDKANEASCFIELGS